MTSVPPGGLTGWVTYRSALLDLTATADNISLGIPVASGFLLVARLITTVPHDISGVATGTLAWSVGNNVNHDNVAAASVTSSTINADAPYPYPIFANGGGLTGPILDGATQIVGKITTAITGVTSLHGYIAIHGFWIPA